MVKGEEWFMIKDMYRQGLSIAEISRRTGQDRKTVRKVIRSTGPPLRRKGWLRPSKLDPFQKIEGLVGILADQSDLPVANLYQ